MIDILHNSRPEVPDQEHLPKFRALVLQGRLPTTVCGAHASTQHFATGTHRRVLGEQPTQLQLASRTRIEPSHRHREPDVWRGIRQRPQKSRETGDLGPETDAQLLP
jgi:hypothetical protein